MCRETKHFGWDTIHREDRETKKEDEKREIEEGWRAKAVCVGRGKLSMGES